MTASASTPHWEKDALHTLLASEEHDSIERPTTFDPSWAELLTGNVSAAEEAVCTMGVPRSLVQMAQAFHCLEHGTDFKDACQLYLATEDLLICPEKQASIGKRLREAAQAKRKKKIKGKDLFSDKLQENYAYREVPVSNSPEMQKKGSGLSVDNRALLRERVRKLAKENRRLWQRKMCKACRKVDLSLSGVTYLPCGHFVTCETCTEKIDDCPACGKSIMGTVRTFLS